MMQVRLITLVAVALMMCVTGVLLGDNIKLFGSAQHAFTDERHAEIDRLESIFIALDREAVTVPVTRSGNGGSLASIGDDLIVMTIEGGFFDVTGDSALPLTLVGPPNGWEDMLVFEEANPEYDFAHFYFRYNDLDVVDDQIIISYTEWVGEQECYRTSLATAPLSGARTSVDIAITSADWSIVFSTEPCLKPKTTGRAIDGHMAGGRFRVTDEGIIYLAAGDYAVDGTYAPRALSQDPTQQYGKIIAIDLKTGTSEIISQGHSNPQGIVIDDDGSIYAVEHGRRGGDELNQIFAGRDYGWPQVSLGTRYNRLPLQSDIDYGRHPIFEPPIFAWLPSVAPSSLTKIDDFHPAWDGDFLVGTLSAGQLIRIRMRDGRVIFNERIPIGMRIRYVHQHDDYIALWTDQRQVVKLRVGQFDASAQFAVAKINDLNLSDAQKANTEAVLDQCVQCHGFGVGAGGNAPALGRVFGRNVGSDSSFEYSDALQNTAGVWTHDTLTSYLNNPDGFAEGTSMPNPQIDDPEVVTAIVDILSALRLQPE